MHNHQHHSHDESSGRIGMAFFLNVSFTVIEFIGGWWTNSTAIMADAVHDLGDSLSIGSAWLLNRQGRKSADGEVLKPYGLAHTTIEIELKQECCRDLSVHGPR